MIVEKMTISKGSAFLYLKNIKNNTINPAGINLMMKGVGAVVEYVKNASLKKSKKKNGRIKKINITGAIVNIKVFISVQSFSSRNLIKKRPKAGIV